MRWICSLGPDHCDGDLRRYGLGMMSWRSAGFGEALQACLAKPLEPLVCSLTADAGDLCEFSYGVLPSQMGSDEPL